MYAAANVIVFGAEFASKWARLPADDEIRRQVTAGRWALRARLPV